jgi:CRISPR-associated exonuclease Cas4
MSKTATRYERDDYLLLSGIQHFSFCRRQWALIHIESQWKDNALTVSGALVHARAHDPSTSEKRGDLIAMRDMPVVSHAMGVRGKCDVVEFRRDENGISLFGREGLWLPCPVEYKRGKPKIIDADRLQLCAQAICLEEMLLCPEIPEAYLFYGEIKRRDAVPLDAALRRDVRAMFGEMRGYMDRGYTPRVKPSKGCARCSVADLCLPKMPREGRVAAYIRDMLSEPEAPEERGGP